MGRLLIETAEAVAQEQQFAEMSLTVRAMNEQAVGFYKHLGWRDVPHLSQNGTIYMRKELPPSTHP